MKKEVSKQSIEGNQEIQPDNSKKKMVSSITITKNQKLEGE